MGDARSFSSGIYRILNLQNGKFYIGSSGIIENRWAVHRLALRSGSHHSPKLQAAWTKYGEEAFRFEIIELVDAEHLIEVEQRYINETGAADRDVGYNVSRIAGSPRGFKHSDDTKRKQSLVRRGRPHSAEHRAAISAALKGRRPSDATIAGSVAYHKGREVPAERREKLAEAMRGAWAEGKFSRRGKP